MLRTLVGMFFGTVFGFLLGGPAGGGLGIVVGFALGGIWASALPAVGKISADTPLAREQQSVLCESRGRVAEATFVRNARNGRWLDVASCSLCTPDEAVTCAKRCLVLMRDVAPASVYPVHA